MKDALYGLAYDAGLLTRYGRHKTRRLLTILNFHRVLPVDDPRWPGADPGWTVSLDLFRHCLDFIQDNFNVATPAAVLAAMDGGARLPARPALITFDDGWADTAEFAARELHRRGLASIVFLATGVVGQRDGFWMDRIVEAERCGRLRGDSLRAMLQQAGAADAKEAAKDTAAATANTADALIARLQALPLAGRARILAHLPPAPADIPDRMVSAEALSGLPALGMAVGGHGVCHEPIPDCPDAAAELRACRADLHRLLGDAATAMFAFPHGRYRPQDLATARDAGFAMLLTSDRGFNDLPDGRPRPVLGRIEITLPGITDDAGRFSAQRMARWIYGQPRLPTLDG